MRQVILVIVLSLQLTSAFAGQPAQGDRLIDQAYQTHDRGIIEFVQARYDQGGDRALKDANFRADLTQRMQSLNRSATDAQTEGNFCPTCNGLTPNASLTQSNAGSIEGIFSLLMTFFMQSQAQTQMQPPQAAQMQPQFPQQMPTQANYQPYQPYLQNLAQSYQAPNYAANLPTSYALNSGFQASIYNGQRPYTLGTNYSFTNLGAQLPVSYRAP